jgi:predicted dehydrogenase
MFDRRPHGSNEPGEPRLAALLTAALPLTTVRGTVLIGILGCGRAAEQLYLPALARIADARLTAAYDPGPERRELIARAAPGCRPFDTAEALLSARVVDAVIVSSPAETHADLAVLALQARVPVLVDVPLTTTLDQAAWLRGEERASRGAVMVGFNRRWWAPAAALRQFLAGQPEDPGATAETVLVSARQRGPDSGTADALHDLVVHHMDLLRFLMDREFATIQAQRDATGLLTLEMTFLGGGSAICRVRFGERTEETVRVSVGGRLYVLRAGSGRYRPAGGLGRRLLDGTDAIRRRLRDRQESLMASHERQLRGFLAMARGEARPVPGTVDGIAVVQAVEAARVSLDHGGAVVEVPATPEV